MTFTVPEQRIAGSEMNRCKDCKHYEPIRKVSHSGSGLLGYCGRWHQGYGSSDEVKSNEVIVENDEGWGAMMGPEFGCVLWEARS